jgi:hypothetical protein
MTGDDDVYRLISDVKR